MINKIQNDRLADKLAHIGVVMSHLVTPALGGSGAAHVGLFISITG